MASTSDLLKDFADFIHENYQEKFFTEFNSFLTEFKASGSMQSLDNQRDLPAARSLLKYFSGNEENPSFLSIYSNEFFQNAENYQNDIINRIRGFNFIFQKFLISRIKIYNYPGKNSTGLISEIERGIFQVESGAISEILEIPKNQSDKNLELREALELGGVGSYYWELTTGNYEVSEQTEKILNVKQGATLQQFLSKIHPEDLSRVQEAIYIASSGDKHFDVEFRITVKGVEKTLWCRGKIITRNGIPVVLQGSLTDLTEKNQLVQNLRRSKQLYKEAQELALLGNWAWNKLTYELEASDVFYKIYNLPVPVDGKMQFQDTLNLIHPDDLPIVMDRIKTTPNDPIDMIYRLKFQDGTIKYIHSRGEVSSSNTEWRYGTIQDVTRQKTTEEKLINEQKFNLKLAEASPAIILSYALGRNEVLFVNKAIKVILGYEPEDIKANGFEFFKNNIHEDDYDEMVEKIRHQVFNLSSPATSDSIFDFQVRLKNKEGNFRWMICYWVVFAFDNYGMPKELLAVAIDNTEQIEAEKEIRQKTIELQQSNASLEEFARVASHDLKEPLRKISTFADRLESFSENLPVKGRTYLEKIRDSAIRMQQLINNLLSVSIITSEKDFHRQYLQPVMEEAMRDLDLKIEETNAEITGSLHYSARINPSQFRQLIQNLVANSLKFSKQGVSPKIEIRGKIVKGEHLKRNELNDDDDYLMITISDNGIGFEPQFSRQIFNIFQRLNDKHEYSGTGIGLAICKKIVENHGGFIEAEGNPGEGSKFIVYLPYN